MIDLKKAENEFESYLANYDRTALKIALKITHTYEVLNSAKYIAESLGLDKENIDLACLIALLHDIGRFEQLKIYDSYDDTKGLDHAGFGIKYLFEENNIRKYVEDDKYDSIIYKAIDNHSKLKIADIDSMTEAEKMHCRIIRDADKLDNYRVKEKESFEALFGIGVTEDVAGKCDISDKVYKTFKENKLIVNTDRITYMDHWVSYLAFTFDLNFSPSLKFIDNKNYVDILVDRINYTNLDTKNKMEDIRKITKDYINSRI